MNNIEILDELSYSILLLCDMQESAFNTTYMNFSLEFTAFIPL